MPDERNCGNCGCYVAEDEAEHGGCHARAPTRKKPVAPQFKDVPGNYGFPLVLPTDHCVHDWAAKGTVEAGLPESRPEPTDAYEVRDGPPPATVTLGDVPDDTLLVADGDGGMKPHEILLSASIQDLTGPAQRTLALAGISTPRELASFTEADAESLKGAGPVAMAEFKRLLEANGLAFMDPGAAAAVLHG